VIDYSQFYEDSFDPNDLDTLEVRFVKDTNHRLELNCGLKVKIDLEAVSSFELLSPCCGGTVEPGLLTQNLEVNGAASFGDCSNCGREVRLSHGPMALEPGPINHVFLFTPELREWFASVLSDYLAPLDSVLASKPLEGVVLAYVDAGAGKTSEGLRESLSGLVMETYLHPFIGKRRL